MSHQLIVKAVVLDEQNRIQILKRSASAPRRPLTWDLPGGFVDENEDEKTACSRELQEEAGINIRPETLHLVYADSGVMRIGDEDKSVNRLYFIGRADNNDVNISHEHTAYAWQEMNKSLEEITYETQNAALRFIQEHDLINLNR